jgi:hypothetical protein
MVRLGIFEPFRALGYITDNVPFVVQRRGIETFVTVSVGKSFQIFNVSSPPSFSSFATSSLINHKCFDELASSSSSSFSSFSVYADLEAVSSFCW